MLKSVFKFQNLILCLSLLAYVGIQSRNIQYPGLHYDEVLFVNAAQGGVDDSFICKRITNVPVLLHFYAGALKAYLYFPIFTAFDVSPLTIRLPMILLTAASIGVLFFAVKAASASAAAWIAFLLFWLSPNLMAHTRMDNGPVAIEFFLRSVCLLVLFKAYKHNARLNLIALYCFFCIGIFNNVKFIWFINSIYAAAAVLYADTLMVEAKKRNTRFFIRGMSAAVLSYLPFIYYAYLISQQVILTTDFYKFSVHNMLLGLREKLSSLIGTITGDGVYTFILGPLDATAGTLYLWLMIAVFVAGFLSMARLKTVDSIIGKNYYSLLTVLIVTLIQIGITTRAQKLWHLFTIQPVFTMLIALSIYAIGRSTWRYHKSIAAGILVAVVFYNAWLVSLYQEGYKNKKSTPFWSEAIYELISYTRQTPGRYFSGDWSIHNQLIAFTQDAYRYQEVLSYLQYDDPDGTTQKKFYERCFKQFKDKHYFILHAEGVELFKNARSNLLKMAAAFNVMLFEQKRIRDESDNRDIFIIYGMRQSRQPVAEAR